MPFAITSDRYLSESVTEYAAILDSELKTSYHIEFESADQKTELLPKLISTIVLLPKINDKAFEPTFNLLLDTLFTLCVENSISYESDVIPKVLESIKHFTNLNSFKNISAISILSNIFNFLPTSSKQRIEIIQITLSNIKQNKLKELIQPLSKNLSVWLSNANATESQIDSITIDSIEILYLENQSEALSSFENLIKKSNTLSSKDYVNFFVKSLNAKLPYKELSYLNLKLDNTLDELLKLYSSLDLSTYLEFIKKNDLTKYQINIETLTEKLTYASITKLALNKSQITYEEVSKSLNLPLSEVESYLIECIKLKLVSGRLSQDKQVFYLHQVSKLDSVSSKDWSEINDSLTAWKSKISELTELIEVLSTKKNKRVPPPPVLQAFHQQKQELKEQQQLAQQQKQEQQAAQKQELAALAAAATETALPVT